MIKTWLLSGDVHGQTDRFSRFKSYPHPEEVAMIVLGDVGFNYDLNYNDIIRKRRASQYGGYIYCVRGNHEERPENIKTMIKEWDSNVCGFVYMEHDFPLIRYFIDGETYLIDGLRTLVIGGAYSVDKQYRLTFGCKWFKNEQLSADEMDTISKKYKGDRFNLILAHTCPRSWQPTDLFLSGVSQSSVDTSMEDWMEEFKEEINWNLYLFGHYHDDRLVRPHVEMLYTNIVNLQELYYRWNGEKKYILKNYKTDPNFFNEDNPWTKDYILLK